jgi:uncharacterized protein YbbC (DUF1343 family)
MKNSNFNIAVKILPANLIIIIAVFWALPFQLKADIKTGAERTSEYLDKLKGKSVGLVVNQTSIIGKTLLVDSLISLKVNVKKIFAPEHGFRGDAEAGKKISDYTDKKTGLHVISLYGDHKKPTLQDLEGIDIMIYDIQDVGVRYFTYISTLHKVMEACAENNKQLILLDRPDPNGYYVDGPVLEKDFSSFVGMDPVPIVYGMTPGEYATMLNGEGWLANGEKCNITVIKCVGYSHKMQYQLSVPPSPNLKTMTAVYLYPSLGLFEGTNVSVGRGTDMPFEIIGKPDFKENDTTFMPRSIPGRAEEPPYMNQLCHGVRLTRFANDYIKTINEIYLYWLIGFYKDEVNKDKFFTPFFDKLAGTDTLRKQIIEGKTPEEIRKSWKPGLDNFKKIRAKHLLYEDFS